jgi:hypothetical protein
MCRGVGLVVARPGVTEPVLDEERRVGTDECRPEVGDDEVAVVDVEVQRR